MTAKKLWKAFPYGATFMRTGRTFDAPTMLAPTGWIYSGFRADGTRLKGKIDYAQTGISFFYARRHNGYRMMKE